ncbi:MAG: hypothetical protein R2762_05540 [Bryobacteraceae bacterium]
MKRSLLLALLLAVPLPAVTVRTSEATLVIGAGEVLDDSLVASAEAIRIEGSIHGDVLAAARRVEIIGQIHGNLIAFAQTLDVDGGVDGSLAGMAQTVTLRGEVGRNVVSGGQDVRVEKNARIHGDLVAFGSSVTSEAVVTRGIRLFAQTGRVGGSVGRDVDFYGGTLDVDPGAAITGNVVARVRDGNDVRGAEAATVGGKVDRILIAEEEADTARRDYGAGAFARVLWELAWFGAALLVGWILYRAAPRFVDRAAEGVENGIPSAGLGFAILFLTPFLLLILALSLIGLPAALIGGALFGVAVYLAKLVVAFWIGGRLAPGASPMVRLAVGLVVVAIAIAIPFLGWLARLVVTAVGLGALLLAVQSWPEKAFSQPAGAGQPQPLPA